MLISKAVDALKPLLARLESPLLLFFVLVNIRTINALLLSTFFQPDEYFQALEPAWALAFGKDSGAWITWEWQYQLRSALHPSLFAGVYYLASTLASILKLSPQIRSQVLLAAPKLLQAFIAATGDFYTVQLARVVYGASSDAAKSTVGLNGNERRKQADEGRLQIVLTTLSAWQWFCSTRTFSNGLETTLTVAALSYWPWEWMARQNVPKSREKKKSENKTLSTVGSNSTLRRLRLSLLLAALACILRPTNILVWIPLAIFLISQTTGDQRYVFVRESVLCGSTSLTVTVLIDRIYYGAWTIPSIQFLYFNLAQSIAVFYGVNNWDYYISQGLPLLLTTYFPLALSGLNKALVGSATGFGDVRFQLACTTIFVISILSIVSHKEVRFIYPLLPVLHVFSAGAFGRFSAWWKRQPIITRELFIVPLLLHFFLIFYVTRIHQSGVIDFMHYLRREYEDKYANQEMSIGFLMPCHSTPWRSHLVYPEIKAWALTCEPPLNMQTSQKAAYLDEADRFYEDPDSFLAHEKRLTSGKGPEYLVFFEQLKPTVDRLNFALEKTGYPFQCSQRIWNSHFHDDRRRVGDVVVYSREPCTKSQQILAL